MTTIETSHAGYLKQDQILEAGRELGVDLIGFAGIRRLEQRLIEDLRPSQIAAQMKTLIVVAKKTFAGLSGVERSQSQQFWGGRIIKRLDECCLKLVVWMEQQGALGYPLSSLSAGIRQGDGYDLCPAGQGSSLLKTAAVEAGLGTLGLNGMLLTPEFGPRVYLGGLLTNLTLEPGRPLRQELCLGLEECGLCAAACPEDAIPRKSRRSAPIAEYRGLDAGACARSSQPLGPRRFKEHLTQILSKRADRDEMWSLIRSRLTGSLWQEMLMIKEGAFTGCSVCVDVCPVGEDYAEIQKKKNIPPLAVTRIVDGDRVEVLRINQDQKTNTDDVDQ